MTLPEDQVRFNLKSMASNYPDGHNWDKLDADVCMRAYDEITALREHIKATASQLALPAGPVPEGWKYTIEAVRARMENDTPSAYDNSGYREYAGVILDAVEYQLAALASPSTAVAQPVADEREEYERMLRTGYQHDNVRRQERGLASSDELTQEQEREIAERVALKFPSDASTSGYPKAGFSKDNPVAFSCAKRTAHPTSGSMTCDTHCGDDVKCLRATIDKPEGERGNA